MSTDVIFTAVFPTAKPAALRFAEFRDLLAKRPEFVGPWGVRGYELIDSGHPIEKLDGNASEPDKAAELQRMLAAYTADKYSFEASWAIRGTHGHHPIRYGPDVTFQSPLTRRWPSRDRDVDLRWDLG